jgi:hypothetical protein
MEFILCFKFDNKLISVWQDEERKALFFYDGADEQEIELTPEQTKEALWSLSNDECRILTKSKDGYQRAKSSQKYEWERKKSSLFTADRVPKISEKFGADGLVRVSGDHLRATIEPVTEYRLGLASLDARAVPNDWATKKYELLNSCVIGHGVVVDRGYEHEEYKISVIGVIAPIGVFENKRIRKSAQILIGKMVAEFEQVINRLSEGAGNE